MYTNSAAVFRGDIAGVLEQAKDWETSLIGTRVMPILNVPVIAGQYPSFKLREGQLLKSEVKVRDPYSTFPRGGPKTSASATRAGTLPTARTACRPARTVLAGSRRRLGLAAAW